MPSVRPKVRNSQLDHRPAAHRAQPRIVEMAGGQRRDAEGKRNRHPDETGVERRRMDRHPVVLQERIEALAVRGRLGNVGRERVLVHDHQVEKEHLHHRDRRDDVGDQLAVPFPIHVDRARSEDRQQEHPEHDRAVEPAPVGRDLVEQRLHAVRVVRDVLDREVVGEKGVDHHRRGDGHERRGEVEGAGAALDERPRTAPRSRHRNHRRVAADDERGKQQERAE